MITRIEALNFRCLRYISQPLDRFHVLVGPNASGKTTFLDVVAFIGRVVSDGLDAALEERSPNFQDQVFGRKGRSFELLIESQLPLSISKAIAEKQSASHRITDYRTLSYHLRFRTDEDSSENSIEFERLYFPLLDSVIQAEPIPVRLRNYDTYAPTIIERRDQKTDYNIETSDFCVGHSFHLPRVKSALANMAEDESRFSAGIWFKNLLRTNIHRIVLDSIAMRMASPPGKGNSYQSDGSNLPWTIEEFVRKTPEAFRDWIDHLKTALPDLEGIRTVERPDDKHRYLMLQYQGGIEVPSWTVSDGTLRLLALTLLAYLPNLEGIYLIEEPENGIHPKAVETMFQSLSNVYGAQILLATHSPVILSMTNPKDILCFTKDEEGATNIVSGDQHPALLHWQHETSLGDLFAAGVLG
ncbi:MAG: ATP-binding protein [Planctomycetaceae bacterium]